MRELGRIVRLQIQRSSLKTGEKPTRVYDPMPLVAVDRLALGPDGALGEGPDGSWLVDVHHRAHPRTKNEDGAHGVSLGFTAHYALMRDRFGERITLGCAGENIIVETEHRIAFEDLARGVVRSEEHTSELQSLAYLVCRLLLEKKKKNEKNMTQETILVNTSTSVTPTERHTT